MIVADVERSGLTESRHHGAVAVVDAAGVPIAGFGAVERPFFIRSAAKPVQATVMRSLGLDLAPELQAVGCASHDADPAHVALVGAVLAGGGLDEDDLRCPPAWPTSTSARRRVIADGASGRRRIWHNCSGKHAAMLRTCLIQGWPTEGYLQLSHPLQRAIADEMDARIGLDGGGGTWGVDGCGAPVTTTSATGLAVLYSRLARSGGPVVEAMRRFPALIGGIRNVDLAVMLALPAIAKGGAEAVLGLAVEGRGAIGIKIWDGGGRAVGPVTFAALDQLGWIPHGSRDELEWRCRSVVLGGGEDVGMVRPAFQLEQL